MSTIGKWGRHRLGNSLGNLSYPLYVVTDADEKTKDAAFEQAEEQLRRYMSDPHLVPMLTRGLDLKAGTLLFIGGKELVFREYAPCVATPK